jgi:hypothetical protein
MTEKKAVSSIKDLAMSFLALVIAILFTVIAFAIAKWALGFFAFTSDPVVTAAAIIAVAIILGPTIAAFATKKYF